jgi:hypothetical protein
MYVGVMFQFSQVYEVMSCMLNILIHMIWLSWHYDNVIQYNELVLGELVN